MEQLSPSANTRHFDIIEVGGRGGGPDVSFISSKFVGSISAALSTRGQYTSPNFLSQPEKIYETQKVGRGKGPRKRKAKRQ